jgi:methylenetetrahydrofolate reductase (NADPH)
LEAAVFFHLINSVYPDIRMFMKITQQLQDADHPLVSVEFFPPKTEAGRATFDQTAVELLQLAPDFVSVTCGAGGTAAGPTLEICTALSEQGYGSVMPHCTCVARSRDEVLDSIDTMVEKGFNNIMALRGDPPKGEHRFKPAPDGFHYAAEMVSALRVRQPDICIGVAGYPEKHPEAFNAVEDIRHLKAKVDAGADFITTQLFLHNHVYFDFVEKCRDAGITVPILPGLLPILSLEQIKRMCAFCDFHVPSQLLHDLVAAQDDPEKMERIGLHWTVDQISELVDGGAPGIHLYLLNRAKTAFDPELFACLSGIRGS